MARSIVIYRVPVYKKKLPLHGLVLPLKAYRLG